MQCCNFLWDLLKSGFKSTSILHYILCPQGGSTATLKKKKHYWQEIQRHLCCNPINNRFWITFTPSSCTRQSVHSPRANTKHPLAKHPWPEMDENAKKEQDEAVVVVVAHPDSDSRHTVGESVGSLLRAAACLARTDTTPPCSSDREPRPGGCHMCVSALKQQQKQQLINKLKSQKCKG